MKTVFITSFHSYISRNVLTNSFLETLRASGHELVLVVPAYKVDFFKAQFVASPLIVEGVQTGQVSRTRRGLFFKRFAELSYVSETTWVKLRYKYHHERKVGYAALACLIGVAGSFFFVRRLMRYLDERFAPRSFLNDLFDRYNPDLVFSTDVYNENDVAVLQTARARGINTIAMVRSWDNPSKYLLRVFPQKLIVSSETLKDEVETFHHYPRERMAINGIPHYDRYGAGPTMTREDLCKHFGLSAERKVIFFSPVGDDLIYRNDVDQHVLDTLASLGEQVIVRFPPASAVAIDLNRTYPPHVAFDVPGVSFSRTNFSDREITARSDEMLLNILAHADVVVTGPTSIPLDAAFFDKPVIVTDFYPTMRHPLDGIYEYAYFHFQKLLRETGGVWHVRSLEEFTEALHAYLEDPARDASKRKKIRDLWFSHSTGEAGRQLGEIILRTVS